MRERICENIGESGFFSWWHLARIDKNEILRDKDSYLDIYGLIDNSTNPSNTNLYDLKEFVMMPDAQFLKDFFFICLFERSPDRAIIPFYISKEYDVSPFQDLYMPGRFVIGNFMPELPTVYRAIMLAEEPARAYEKPDFYVELHYIQLRKYVHPGKA